MSSKILTDDLPAGPPGDLALRLFVLGGLSRQKHVRGVWPTSSPADWLRLLAWLPPECRVSVALRMIDGLSTIRIGEILGLEAVSDRPRSAIHHRLNVAYKILRPLIEKGVVVI